MSTVRYPIVIYPDGTWHVLQPGETLFGSGGMTGVPLYIQDDAPTVDPGTKYMWIQTNYGEPGGFTFWFDDGA